MKKRIDQLLVDKGLVDSRAKAQAMIMAGLVFIDNKKIVKAGEMIADDANIILQEGSPYVSRGAEKLIGAVKAFGLGFQNKIIADVGSSTGGFTDYALQHGAKKVYAIDVGTGQLAWRLRNDPRVTVMEKTHIKDVEILPEPIDLWLVDVSFISLRKVLPEIIRIHFLSAPRYPLHAVVLFKPQFEAGKKIVDKTRGVITDPEIHAFLKKDFEDWCLVSSWNISGSVPSPVVGDKGNQEFFYYLQYQSK